MLLVAGLGILVLLVGGLAFYAHHSISKPVTIPERLGGLSVVTDPDLRALDVSQITDASAPWANGAEMYGSKEGLYILFVTRGQVVEEEEFANFESSSGIALGERQAFAEATCREGRINSVTEVYCIRSSSGLSVEVLGVGKEAAVTARALDEAWDLQ